MNQGFKLRFDQMREGNPDSSAARGEDVDIAYTTPGHARNVCFVWPDGRKAFFNYAYLLATEFEPNADQNMIELNFSSHQVSLSGYRLEPLFMALLDQLPRMVIATDLRYASYEPSEKPVVIEIKVTTDSK